MTTADKIKRLKKERNAVILAHYYVGPEVQEIADYVGDSFYLSKIAAGLEAEILVFCGVYFMGESAKVLSPGKTVLLPELSADCAMAHMASPERIRQIREEYEDVAVVCYINSTAELKRHSDVCVTSANALKIVRRLPNKNIYFIPDQNLAHFVAEQVPEKHFIFNEGFCPVHAQILVHQVEEAKKAHPQAKVLVHPECAPSVLELADYIGSTSGIIQYAKESSEEAFIICTEDGVEAALNRCCPGKRFYFTAPRPVCQDMKEITLEKILHVLETGENQVHMETALLKEAKKPLEEMLRLG